MKKYAETIVTIIITFIVSLILNTSLNYLIQDRGSIKFGSVIKIVEQYYLVLDIENYDDKPVDGFLLAIPSNTVKSEIVSSHPLDVMELPSTTGSNQIKYVKISGVEPHSTIELLIPVSDPNEQRLIRFTNLEQLGYVASNKANTKSPFQIAFQESLKIAILNSILYSILVFWMSTILEKDQKKSKERTDELKAEIENARKEWNEERTELKNEIAEEREEIKGTTKRFHRIRLLLLARLSDYGKELDFWRDTIRKILYESKTEEKTVEKLFDQVTKSLKTYSTQERDIDFNVIETLATMLNNDDKR